MIRFKKRERAAAEIPIVSMADISFLLLLFFLVTSTIDIDTGIGLNLPRYTAGNENFKSARISPDRFRAIQINENGDIFLDKNPVSLEDITLKLKPEIRSRIQLPSNEKLIVSLKTSRKTSYQSYIQVLDKIKTAYFEVQEDYAASVYGKKLYQLNESERRVVTEEKIPVAISIAEPEVMNKQGRAAR